MQQIQMLRFRIPDCINFSEKGNNGSGEMMHRVSVIYCTALIFADETFPA